jgi:DNA-binding transcriptional LysR family regulator
MNWSSVAFDWNQVRAFLVTVEEGSLSAASRALGQSQPTIGRQVSALEEQLGVTLFERVGRSLELTSAGVELLDHVRAMGDAANRISLVASGRSQAVDGHVTITASDVLSAYQLPAMLERIRSEAPGITVEIVAANDIRNLQRREADIAIRHVRPEQPELIAKLIGEATARCYAAPALLDRLGRPKILEDFAKFPFIGFGDDDRFIEHMTGFGLPIHRGNIPVSCESGLVSWALVRQGLGVGVMSVEVAAMTPEVELVMPEMEPFKFPVWLAVHRELNTSRRIRLVFDILAEEITSRMIV